MKIKQHHFSVELAEKIGVERAVLMANIEYWLDWSKAHGKNIHDNYHWTYNSASAFAKLFPYMSKHTIGRHLKVLEEDGYLISGNFNKAGYDRTKWYTTPDYLILQKCNMDIADVQNGSCKSATPIPVTKPLNKPVSKPFAQKENCAALIEQGFNIFYFAGLVKRSKAPALKKFKSMVKQMKADPVELGELLAKDVKQRIANQQMGINSLHPSTYLNQERWEDEAIINEQSKASGKQSMQDRILTASGYGQRESRQAMGGNGGDIRGTVDQGARSQAISYLDPQPEQAGRTFDQDGVESDY